MNKRSQRPTAETIVPRLLDAVEALCAKRAPDEVSMRMIAEEANLSVGVAYRYFESREALLGATLDRIGERLATAGAQRWDPQASIEALWRDLDANPAFPRLFTWLAMSGRTPTEVMSKHPVVRDLSAAAAREGLRAPDTAATVLVLLAMGGHVFGPTANRATGRAPGDERVYDAVVEMLVGWNERQREPGP